jgi:hypothetical protein
VASYAPLTIDGYEVTSFRNGVDLSVVLLFGPSELNSRLATLGESDRWEYKTIDEEITVYELASTASAVSERLNVLGIGMRVVTETFDKITDHRRDLLEHSALRLIADPEIQRSSDRERQILETLTIDQWIDSFRERYQMPVVDDTFPRTLHSLPWLMSLWEESDPRVLIRAVLAAVPLTSEVRIDVTDIVDGGYLSLDENPHDVAMSWMADEITSGSPAIVLTEGPTDARFLEGAIEVLKPHLRGYVRFPDFSQRPESNASALVRTVRTFAAAGIQNRVIALFDNDTAGMEALRSLRINNLPKNISVMALPPLPLAVAYPTLGPGGSAVMDVNGRGASIELYLGEDVLRDDRGELRPIRWGGFNSGIDQYQGEIEYKRAIQMAYDSKVRSALLSADPGEHGDWSGLELILNSMIQVLSQ